MLVQQKLFMAVMVAQFPTFVKFAVKATGYYSGLLREVLQLTCSLSELLVLVLSFTFSMTMLWSNRISRWNKLLFVGPVAVFIFYLMDNYVMADVPGDNTMLDTIYHAIYAIATLGSIVFGLINIPRLIRHAENNMAEGVEAYRPVIKQYIVSVVAFIIMQLPFIFFVVVREEQLYYWMVAWAVSYSVVGVYMNKLVLYNIFVDVTPEMMFRQEENTQLLKRMMDTDAKNDEDLYFFGYEPEVEQLRTNDMPDQQVATAASAPVSTEAPTTMAVRDEAKKTRGKQIERYFDNNRLSERLNQLMDEKEVYKQRNITIAELAQMLGTNQYYLSIYLNDVLGLKFSDYINFLRIRRIVQPYLEQHPDASAAELCSMSGFQHPATFYRAILKCTGLSFPDYRRSLSN